MYITVPYKPVEDDWNLKTIEMTDLSACQGKYFCKRS